MKKGSIYVLLATLIIAAAAAGIGALLLTGVTPESQAAPGHTGSDVIMMRCSTTSSGFTVKAFQRSTSSPDKTSDNCAEALSKIMDSGFSIRDTGYNQDGEFMIITLVR